MRYAVLAIVLTGAMMVGGCSEGVFDPKGPVAAAERQILSNSLGIMLAIRTMPPFLMSSVRFLLAGAFLFALSPRRRASLQAWAAALVAGGALLTVGNGGMLGTAVGALGSLPVGILSPLHADTERQASARMNDARFMMPSGAGTVAGW